MVPSRPAGIEARSVLPSCSDSPPPGGRAAPFVGRRGGKRVFCEVRRDNEGLLRAYEGFGLVPMREKQNAPGDVLVEMLCRL